MHSHATKTSIPLAYHRAFAMIIFEVLVLIIVICAFSCRNSNLIYGRGVTIRPAGVVFKTITLFFTHFFHSTVMELQLCLRRWHLSQVVCFSTQVFPFYSYGTVIRPAGAVFELFFFTFFHLSNNFASKRF